MMKITHGLVSSNADCGKADKTQLHYKRVSRGDSVRGKVYFVLITMRSCSPVSLFNCANSLVEHQIRTTLPAEAVAHLANACR